LKHARTTVVRIKLVRTVICRTVLVRQELCVRQAANESCAKSAISALG
jgi:hypothetical protein